MTGHHLIVTGAATREQVGAAAILIVDNSACISDVTGCREWLRPPNSSGYGQVTWLGQHYGAHQLAYLIFEGPIPEGMEIDHLCGFARCVQTRHMEPVTRDENQRRIRARKKDNTDGFVALAHQLSS